MDSVKENALAIAKVSEPAPKKTKASKPNKPKSSSSSSHPPYVEMIGDAIMALKERTGSSQYAIAKFIEEKHRAHLPPNFKKMLLIQLKKLVAADKLVKIKNSFKIGVKKPKPAAAVEPKPSAVKPKPKLAAKKKMVAPAKPKQRPAKALPGKKVASVKPVKAKKPKSVKSPAKKTAAAKKGKRVTK